MRVACAVFGLLVFSAPARAQHVEKRFPITQDSLHEVHGWTPMRVAKWSTLVASTSAAAYGFTQNRTADREYEDIERLCIASSASCDRKSGSDVYADPSLEARYQTVVQRDDRAKVALLAGQIGLAASVLLFIIDLPKNTGSEDIPYEPKPLRIGFTRDAVQLSMLFMLR